MHKII
jgi:hypothetical protein